MAIEATTITVTDDTDLSDVLDAASREPVRLVRGGVTYRLVREGTDLWASYDSDRLLEGMKATAGVITPEEADRWKEAVYRARQEGTRPTTRP